MKKTNCIKKAIAVFLSILMLTNCTAYRVVPQEPAHLQESKKMVLYKDGLMFVIDPVDIRNDTLFARLENELYEPARASRANVYLVPGQELVQDSLGILAIPFSIINHTEYYVKDPQKTRRNILLLTGGTLVVGCLVFTLVLMSAMNEIWEMPNVTFRI